MQIAKHLVFMMALGLTLTQVVSAQRASSDHFLKQQKEKGNAHFSQGNTKAALRVWKGAVQYADSLHVEKNSYISDICNNISYLYTQQDEYGLAVDFGQKALQYLGRDSMQTDKRAIMCNAIGYGYMGLNKPKEASAYFEKAVHWQRKKNNKNIVEWLSNWAEALHENKEFRRELDCLEEAQRWAIYFDGKNSLTAAAIYERFAYICLRQQMYQQAIAYYKKAILIFKKDKNSEVALISVYSAIGFAYHKISAYQPAQDYLLNALSLHQKKGASPELLAEIYQRLGTVYEALMQDNIALNYRQKSLAIQQQIPQNAIQIIATFNNLGNAYRFKNKLSEAKNYQRKALAEALKNDFVQETADIYYNIGQLYTDNGKTDSALIFFEKGIKLLQKNNKTQCESMTMLWLVKADAHIQKKEIALAEEANSLGFVANQNMLPADSSFANRYTNLPLHLELKLQQAIICEQKMQYQAALLIVNDADSLASEQHSQLWHEKDRLTQASLLTKLHETGLRLCLKLYESDRQDKWIARAFFFSERSKMQVLLQSISHHQLQQVSGIPDSLQRRERTVRLEMEMLQQEIASNVNATQAQIDSFQQQYQQAALYYEQWQEMVAEKYPAYFSLGKLPKTIALAAVQAALKPQQACVSYFVGDSLVYVFVITDHNTKLLTQKIGMPLAKQIRNLRRTIMLAANEDFLKQSRLLYQQIWLPVENALAMLAKPHQPYTHISIIPNGALLYLPFEVLIGQNTGSLLEKYSLSYQYSATLWHEKKYQPTTATQGCIAFAPVFDQPLQKWQPVEILRDNTSSKNKIIALPASAGEILQLDSLFQRHNTKADLYLRKTASEAAVKSGILENYRYVHFATHGIINDENSDFSGLLLLRDSLSTNDGKLYASEIYNLKLRADLVVLSACESGLGKLVEGEGLVGLSRSFLYAGATNLSVSLWRVADEPTRILMGYFYDAILKQDQTKPIQYADALRSAKLKLLKNKQFSSPYYWSAFILIGG